jgi:hypothetical protein
MKKAAKMLFMMPGKYLLVSSPLITAFAKGTIALYITIIGIKIVTILKAMLRIRKRYKKSGF